MEKKDVNDVPLNNCKIIAIITKGRGRDEKGTEFEVC